MYGDEENEIEPESFERLFPSALTEDFFRYSGQQFSEQVKLLMGNGYDDEINSFNSDIDSVFEDFQSLNIYDKKSLDDLSSKFVDLRESMKKLTEKFLVGRNKYFETLDVSNMVEGSKEYNFFVRDLATSYVHRTFLASITYVLGRIGAFSETLGQ